MESPRKEAVQGRWTHSHEEDTEDEMVFRPADRPFPPSRGRTSFELRPDGTYTEASPGPVDVPERTTGRWSLQGNRLALEAEGEGEGRILEIASIEDARLAFRK